MTLENLGRAYPLVGDRLGGVVYGCLPLGRRADEEACVEAARRPLRGDPATHVVHAVDGGLQALGGAHVGEGPFPGGDGAAVPGEAFGRGRIVKPDDLSTGID